MMAEAKPYRAWFESLKDSSEQYPLEEIIYTDQAGDCSRSLTIWTP